MNFDKEAKSDKKNGEWGGGGGGGGGALKPKQQTVSNEVNTKMQLNYLHNVEHVVQSAFQNTLISF